jgi:hypothetical protein
MKEGINIRFGIKIWYYKLGHIKGNNLQEVAVGF